MEETSQRQIAPSPAILAGDSKFVDFVSECTKVADLDDAQNRIADLTRTFVRGWRMQDPRFLQVQANSPYASYLLYLSETDNLCIVLDIFMAQQAAVTHNHLCWCVFSCLEGVEREFLYEAPDDLSSAPFEVMSRLREPGEVTIAGATRGDFHQVQCERGDMAISLHIYGADIGHLERQLWDEAKAKYVPFRSGYTNSEIGLPAYLTFKDVK